MATENEGQIQDDIADRFISSLDELERLHEEIMNLDAMPIRRGMAWVHIYAKWHAFHLGTLSLARDAQHIKAAGAAHYRYRERELAFSWERAEQRALWLVPLIHWGFGAVGSVALASAVWAVRFA